MIRVAVIDDHTIVRNGLTQLIQSDPELVVIGTAPDGEAGVVLCVEHRPDVVLMDLSMPGSTASRRLAGSLRQAPDVQVVVLTSFVDRRDRRRPRLGRDRLPRQGRRARRGASPDPRRRSRRVADRFASGATMLDAQRAPDPPDVLTERERQVLSLVSEGLPNKQIARRLEISEKTVKAHLTSAFRAIGVDDRMQAGMWARRHGL